MSIFLVLIVSLLSMDVSGTTFPKMNDISYEDYQNFTQEWSLVTVRYRKDSGEMRFSYANAIALKALKDEVTDYPDGAVFGKVSFITDEDPRFLSSVMPVTPSRIQLMVRNKKKYARDNGWGYALFSPDGLLKPGDMVEKTQSCVACHSIVEDSGHVFSRPIGFIKTKSYDALEGPNTQKIFFVTRKKDKLPAVILKLLPSQTKELNDLQGVLKKHFFYGTFDEIKPTLARKAIESQKPSLLLGDDNQSFSLVYIDHKNSKKCEDNELRLKSFHTGPKPQRKVLNFDFCMRK